MTELVAEQEYIDLDSASLAEVEAFIEPRLHGFVEAGVALMAVRERRLYLEAGYDRFDDYCRERWDMNDSRARQLCDAAQVYAITASTDVTDVTPVENEAQARELAPLLDEPDKLRAVWQETCERAREQRRSAALVRAVRNEHTRKDTPPARSPGRAQPPPVYPARCHRAFMLITQAMDEVRALGAPAMFAEDRGSLDADVRALWRLKLAEYGQLLADSVAALG